MIETVSGEIVAVTDKAVLLKIDDDTQEWFPFSLLDSGDFDNPMEARDIIGEMVDIEIPEWLAEQKGLR
jgi:hypothetical protein